MFNKDIVLFSKNMNLMFEVVDFFTIIQSDSFNQFGDVSILLVDVLTQVLSNANNKPI